MTTEHVKPSERARAGKYLTFVLADETYGVDILRVREIIGMIPITTVPRTPPFMKGVINLRGKIIPVVDLRLKFGIPSRQYARETCIVILDVPVPSGRALIGSIVDAVNEVTDVTEAELEEIPEFGVRIDTSFLIGLARTKNGVKTLLNIEKVLSHQDIVELGGTSVANGAASPGGLVT